MDKKDQDSAGNGSHNCKMCDLREVYFILLPSVIKQIPSAYEDRTGKTNTLLPLIPHPQNLHHPNKDVQKIQFQTNTLIDHIFLYHSRIGQPRMM